MSVIGYNAAAVNAAYYLNQNTNSLNSSIAELASGSRLADASNDAAGVAVSRQHHGEHRRTRRGLPGRAGRRLVRADHRRLLEHDRAGTAAHGRTRPERHQRRLRFGRPRQLRDGVHHPPVPDQQHRQQRAVQRHAACSTRPATLAPPSRSASTPTAPPTRFTTATLGDTTSLGIAALTISTTTAPPARSRRSTPR